MFIFSGLDGVTLSSVVRFIKLAFCYDMWTIFDSMLDCALIYVKVMNDKCRIFVFLQRRAFKPPNQLLVSGDRWVVRNISVVTACLVIGCPLFEWCGNGHFFPGFCSTSLWLYIAIFYPTMLLFTEKVLLCQPIKSVLWLRFQKLILNGVLVSENFTMLFSSYDHFCSHKNLGKSSTTTFNFKIECAFSTFKIRI